MSAKPAKDTIYIDAEDEITAIIDKMRESPSKIVALVLPKRSPTLQSVVNLKLLKLTATNAKKNLVLITSEASLLPLAGAVGLHVAKTLQSQPSIPAAPSQNDTAITVDNEASVGDNIPLDPTASVGQLAGQLATEETIELDNEAAAEAAPIVSSSKSSVNNKLKVPDFNRFRIVLFGGIALLILLIVGGIFAFVILPKAHIVIKTDSSSISTDLKLTAAADAKIINSAQGIVPAITKQFKKNDTEKVPATGQRDEGTKAAGTVTLTNCNKADDTVTVPAGSILSTSNAGTALAYVTTDTVTIAQSNFTGGGVCKNDSFKNVAVTAQAAGGQYNLTAHRQFSIAITGISGTDSSALAGGTSKIVQIVSQQDIDRAKQKVIDRLNALATSDLKAQFVADNVLPLIETFAAGAPIVTSTPNVNDPGSDVTVVVTNTYTEVGVKQVDLKQLIEADVKKHIDTTKQVIQDNGLSKAVVLVTDKAVPTQVKFQVKTIAVAGPQLDADGIKKQVAGKKKGETVNIIQARPGIKDVNITYSPFWVFSTPSKTNHITVTFEQNNAPK